MKVNEVRIGNWITDEGEYCQVKQILHDQEELEEEKPIPLTPEILEKGGFTAEYGYGEVFFNKSVNNFIGLRLDDNLFQIVSRHFHDDGFGNDNYGKVLPCGTIIKYIHQLQNLYFALTGEELQIYL